MAFASDSETNLQNIKRCAFRVRIGFANVREQLRFHFRSVLMSSYTLSRSRAFASVFLTRSAARPRRRVRPDRNLKEPGAEIALQRSGFESPARSSSAL